MNPRERTPFATLLLASLGISGLVGVVNGAWLAWGPGVGRIKDLEVFWALHRLLEKTQPSLLDLLPQVVRAPFQLDAPASLGAFLILAVAANMLAGFGSALVLSLPVVILWKILPPGDRAASQWFWNAAYPLGVLVGFALPVVTRLIRVVTFDDAPWFVKLSVIATLFFALWLGLLSLLRQRDRIQRFVTYSCTTSFVVTCLVLGASGLTVLVSSNEKPLPDAARPNILLISIDSLRSDHLGSYGYERDTSPVIDGLAREGALFRTVVSPTSWTLPSHLTLLTSQPPEQHMVGEPNTRLSTDAVTLAELTWNAGYSTAGFVGGPFLDAIYGFAQGFDHYDDYSVSQVWAGKGHQGSTSPKLIHAAERWLQDWNDGGRGRPFFIFLHMWDVHYDYSPPPPYDRMFDPDYEGAISGNNFVTNSQINRKMNPRDLQHVIALYDGEIRFTDLHLGKLFDRLRSFGIFDETIIAITADHGEEFFEHGHKGHRKTLYDETLLVPLVIRFPPKVPQRIIEGQFRLMDVAPTILSLADLGRPEQFGTGDPEGPYSEQDLTPWMLESSPQDRPPLLAFSELTDSEWGINMTSVRTETLKLIQNSSLKPEEELYDLVADPEEKTNLAGLDPQREHALRATLSEWTQRWATGLSSVEKIQLSKEQLERLRSLGYVR